MEAGREGKLKAGKGRCREVEGKGREGAGKWGEVSGKGGGATITTTIQSNTCKPVPISSNLLCPTLDISYTL